MSKVFEGIDFSGFDAVAQHQEAREGASASDGRVELPIDEVIEDPNQPRRSFDPTKLKELADTIRERGVLQPITVRPKNEKGKYVIVMGARRYRAAHMAGRETVSAYIRVEPADSYDQMIENIQRENLLHADIARFIEKELARGAKPAKIASSLGKPRSWVSLYTGFSQMHEAIRERVEDLGIRAAYELQKAAEIDEAATVAFLNTNDAVTTREAEAFSRQLKGTSRAGEGEAPEPSPQEENAALQSEPETQPVGDGDIKPVSTGATIAKQRSAVAIIVQVKDRVGRLVTDRAADQGARYGIVSFDNGAAIEEVPLSKVKLIEIMLIE